MWLGGLILGFWLVPALALAGEFFTLRGHGGPIRDIAVSPDGQRILTASFDTSLGLWTDGAPRWFEGHEAAVTTVRFVDNLRAVSAGDDFAVILWDLATGQGERLGRHKGKILSLRVSPDGRTVASASWDGRIGLWPLDGSAPRFIDTGANVNDVAFLDGGRSILSASADGRIRSWDTITGAPLRLVLSNGFGVNRLLVDEARGTLVFGTVDGGAQIVDLVTGELIRDVTLGRRPILALASSRDGRYLAIGDGEGYIMLLDSADWSVHADFRATLRGPIWALAFSADGENIHAGGLDDTLYSWPLADPRDAPKMELQDRSPASGTHSAANGEDLFHRRCAICHTLTGDSARRAGPSLANLFGRRAGSVPDYSYSQTLQQSRIIWNAATIDALFDQGPDVYIRGTKMPVQRITRPGDRADLIEYLSHFSETKENLQ